MVSTHLGFTWLLALKVCLTQVPPVYGFVYGSPGGKCDGEEGRS